MISNQFNFKEKDKVKPTAKQNCSCEQHSQFSNVESVSDSFSTVKGQPSCCTEISGRQQEEEKLIPAAGGKGQLRSAILESNLSDHDDEDSETESAIAAYSTMTLLTPEENQGDGDDSSATAAVDSDEDELTPSLPLDLDSEDISPSLHNIENPVPCLKPILDSQEVLSGLERDKRSPSRSSVDVECESVVSDYSELGGPLKDIERDVNFIDKDLLRAEDASSFLALGSSFWDKEDLDKKEGESEEEFERRVRKVNLLSLAQEFAELKKLDSHACAINFHKNQSVRNLGRGASPLSSRGQSLERSGRRTASKSPLRSLGRRLSKEVPCDNSMNEVCAQRTNISSSDLPASTQGKSILNMVVPRADDDLPVNEARRRDSSANLPANMRPERCANSPSLSRRAKTPNASRSRDGSGNRVGGATKQASQGSSDFDGDFDVFNIETALPQMNWEILEKQLQSAADDERQRLEVIGCVHQRLLAAFIKGYWLCAAKGNGCVQQSFKYVVSDVSISLWLEASIGELGLEASVGELGLKASVGELGLEASVGELGLEASVGELGLEASVGELGLEASVGELSLSNRGGVKYSSLIGAQVNIGVLFVVVTYEKKTQWSIPSDQYPVVNTQWSILSGQYPVVNVQWSILSSQYPVVNTLWSLPLVNSQWSIPCGQYQVVNNIWSTPSGHYPVSNTLWSIPCDRHPVVNILWSMPSGQHPVIDTL
ncbi:hypothetical protein Btru_038231 [Bulinus truncatus]|nr:hypothetical protein Btru_038231 [Bulinus truncatus]